MSSVEEVKAFLAETNRRIEAQNWVFIDRDVNLKALENLGLTKKAAVQGLKYLCATDFCEGPVPDRDKPGQSCWVFGQRVEGVMCYVKLIHETEPHWAPRLKILSFHEATWELDFPHREAPAAGD